jgi:hypothetical protein
MRRGPRLTLDAQGVHDRSLGVGVIAWDDIVSVEPYWVAGKNPFIALQLRDGAKYLARGSRTTRVLSRLNAAATFPSLSLNLVGVDADPVRVAELIMAQCDPAARPDDRRLDSKNGRA